MFSSLVLPSSGAICIPTGFAGDYLINFVITSYSSSPVYYAIVVDSPPFFFTLAKVVMTDQPNQGTTSTSSTIVQKLSENSCVYIIDYTQQNDDIISSFYLTITQISSP